MSILLTAIDNRPLQAASCAALLPFVGLILYLPFELYLIPLALGLGAGLVHVLSGPDHLAAGAVGLLHGLAGSAHLLGILPALALPTTGAAAVYLLAFGLGSIAAMSAFAAFVGGAERRIDGRRLLAICSMLSIAVGGYWTIA